MKVPVVSAQKAWVGGAALYGPGNAAFDSARELLMGPLSSQGAVPGQYVGSRHALAPRFGMATQQFVGQSAFVVQRFLHS